MITDFYKIIMQSQNTNTRKQVFVNKNDISLSTIEIREDYKKEWNERSSDFLLLTKNGEPISNNLYRLGGMSSKSDIKNNYFLLLKYVESFYDENILKMSGNKDPKHLSGLWCIIDSEGNEKIVFEKFKSPYLVKNSVIYSLNNKYYNIETQELYCDTSTSMETSGYLFLDNRYDKDKGKRGVLKINKIDGSFELFKQ